MIKALEQTKHFNSDWQSRYNNCVQRETDIQNLIKSGKAKKKPKVTPTHVTPGQFHEEQKVTEHPTFVQT